MGLGLEKELEELTQEMERKMIVSLDQIDWIEAGEEFKWAVLLKLASGKQFQKKRMVDVLEKVWKLSQPVEFRKVEKNLMLIVFKTEVDQIKVMEGGPWTFDGNVLLLQKWESGMTGADFDNTKFNTWIHIYGLPFELRRPNFGKIFAEYAGRVVSRKNSSATDDLVFGGEYVRVRVELDTKKPILPGLFLERMGRKPTWIQMKYVKLPNVCYGCGMFTHETKSCKQKREGDKIYGEWLKAEDNSMFTLEWKVEELDNRLLVIPPPCVDGLHNRPDQLAKKRRGDEGSYSSMETGKELNGKSDSQSGSKGSEGDSNGRMDVVNPKEREEVMMLEIESDIRVPRSLEENKLESLEQLGQGKEMGPMDWANDKIYERK